MKTVVLMGFGSSSSFYKDIFSFEHQYTFEGIKKDEEVTVVAWSMGTLKAFENIEKYNIKKLVLISPTRNFCLSTPSIIVKKMIKGIDKNKELTLKNFIELNFYNRETFEEYYEKYRDSILGLDNEKLKEELSYLKDTVVEEKEIDIETLVLLGKRDKIISVENSSFSIEKIKNKKVISYDCGHNILFEEKETVKLVGSFLSDT